MSERTDPQTSQPGADRGPRSDEAGRRAPYEPPRLVSGPAFENVLLSSTIGNNLSVFEGCTDPAT